METLPICIGRSHDDRTNRWKIICPKCEKAFEPFTTRLGTQQLDCPRSKCGAEMMAYYNNEPPVVKLVNRK